MAAWGQSAEDFYREGMRRAAQKELKEAEKLFSKAIALSPDSARYFISRGQVYVELEMRKEAFLDFTSAIRLNRNDPFPYYLRATLETGSDPYESIKDGNMVIMLSTADSLKKAAYINNGAARGIVRDFEGAYQDLLKALSYDSLDPAAYINLANVMRNLGDTAKAIGYCFKAHQLDTTLFMPIANIGFIRATAGDYKGALPYFDWALRKKPDASLVYNNRGYAKMKLGDLKGALADIEHSLKLFPQNSYAYRNRALVYIEEKKYKKACEDLHTASALGFKLNYGDEVDKLIKEYCK
jgi:tetratricopeptide (TPR) repeat protein